MQVIKGTRSKFDFDAFGYNTVDSFHFQDLGLLKPSESWRGLEWKPTKGQISIGLCMNLYSQ